MKSPKALTTEVLHVGKFYPPHMGGIETHLQTLCTEIRKSIGVRVIVASDAHVAAEETVDGVAVSRLATPLTLFSAPFCPAAWMKIGSSQADLLHIHLPNPAAVLAYLVSGYRGRVVFTYHSDTVRQKTLGRLFEPMLHAALRRSSAIIATSPEYARTSPILAAYPDRCHVIPYGVPLHQFAACNSDAVQKVKQKYGERLILSVGRLVYYKGFEYLIRAMARVRGRLLIVGDGPLRGALTALVAELGLKAKVVFLGEVQNQDVVPYYHAADLFALASIARSEAFGIVQIEAMAAGKPVINTSLDSGVPFVSLDGETGLTVPPENPEAMAIAINKLLDQPDLRHRYGEAARQRAATEFSVEVMVARTLSLYENVLGRPLHVSAAPPLEYVPLSQT